MKFTDAAELVGTRKTSDGYLVADVRVARAGNVQRYTGAEVGKPDMDFVDVYRPEEEVFKRDALASFAHRPVTIDHPSDAVSADNWKSLAVGQIGEDVARDGEFVRVPMILMDRRAIDAVASGKREISMGYMSRVDFGDGVTPDGTPYNAVQRDLRMNHAAIVDRGRAGPECRIGDWVAPDAGSHPAQPVKERSMTDANKQSLVVDGLTVSLDARDAEIVKRTIDNLTSKLADAEKAKEDMEREKAKEDEEHEKDMAKKDAMIDELKGQVLDTEALDARVQARADLISTAKAIVGDSLEFKGKPDGEIRKAVVVAKLGDEAIAGKSDAYVDARFDILAEAAAKGDPIRDASRRNPAHGTANTNDADAAHREYVDHISNAWKGDNKGAA